MLMWKGNLCIWYNEIFSFIVEFEWVGAKVLYKQNDPYTVRVNLIYTGPLY